MGVSGRWQQWQSGPVHPDPQDGPTESLPVVSPTILSLVSLVIHLEVIIDLFDQVDKLADGLEVVAFLFEAMDDFVAGGLVGGGDVWWEEVGAFKPYIHLVVKEIGQTLVDCHKVLMAIERLDVVGGGGGACHSGTDGGGHLG